MSWESKSSQPGSRYARLRRALYSFFVPARSLKLGTPEACVPLLRRKIVRHYAKNLLGYTTHHGWLEAGAFRGFYRCCSQLFRSEDGFGRDDLAGLIEHDLYLHLAGGVVLFRGCRVDG